MPGMRLDFLKNTSQRCATGKSMPLKQVEAVLLYGRPEQRAKVVQKLLPNTYSLCLKKETHHILLTLLLKCDALVRVQILYNMRRKIADLSMSPVGNIIVQELIERLPAQQRQEIAEVFVLNAEEDEFRRLCEHRFGNHVAQKLLEDVVSREVVEERFVPYISSLAVHPYGQRVVAKYIDSAEEGWRVVSKALFATNDGNVREENVSRLFRQGDENMTISALIRHPLVSSSVKDVLYIHLCEHVVKYLNPLQATQSAVSADIEKRKVDDEFGLPDFDGGFIRQKNTGNKSDGGREGDMPRFYYTYVTAFEAGDVAQRKRLWDSLLAAPGLIEHLVSHKRAVAVAVAAIKTFSECQGHLWKATFSAESTGGTELDVLDVSRHSARTMLLRAMMEVRSDMLTADQRKRLANHALELSQDPVSSPVLQKLLECYPDDGVATVRCMFESIRCCLRELVIHGTASYLIQAMLQHCNCDTVRAELVDSLLGAAFADLHEALSYAQGSRVMQKLLAYAADEDVIRVIDILLSEEEKEEGAAAAAGGADDASEGIDCEANGDDKESDKANAKRKLSRREQLELNRKKHYGVASRTVVSYALHNHACYVIQALLRECRSRYLETHRKKLMNKLKPFVFELSVSPWAGRVVLDTMLQSGSAQLSRAIKNVVFLKAEAWLSDVPEKSERRGSGMDPTMRQMLRRGREEFEDQGEKQQEEDDKNGKRRKRRKLHRSVKK